jgi:hypothetical protein
VSRSNLASLERIAMGIMIDLSACGEKRCLPLLGDRSRRQDK